LHPKKFHKNCLVCRMAICPCFLPAGAMIDYKEEVRNIFDGRGMPEDVIHFAI
jgi:hypothetical protein